MKMTKKALFGALALAMLFGFASCKEEDDENDMIQGGGSNYTIAYTNTSDETSRGYSSTRAGHDGALVQFTFDSSSTDGGVLGLIWDYVEEDGKRNFWVLGITDNRTADGKIEYYVSKYYNVTDINANNFGADPNTNSKKTLSELASLLDAGEVCEYDKTGGFIDTQVAPSAAAVSIWADIYPTLGDDADEHVAGTQDDRDGYTGGFTVKLYKSDPRETGADEIGTVTISETETGYDEDPSELQDKKYAVYANVYRQNSLNGSWTLVKDYHAAEVIADAE